MPEPKPIHPKTVSRVMRATRLHACGKKAEPINPKTRSRVMREVRSKADPKNMARVITPEHARKMSLARWAKAKEGKE